MFFQMIQFYYRSVGQSPCWTIDMSDYRGMELQNVRLKKCRIKQVLDYRGAGILIGLDFDASD